MGKSTISMAIFNSFLLNYQRVYSKRPAGASAENATKEIFLKIEVTRPGKRLQKKRSGKIHHAMKMGKSTTFRLGHVQ